MHRPQPLADRRTQISRSGCRYRANAQTTFFCLVDGPRSRLLRPWSRVPGARCGHVALSLNCKDLVPNGALSAIHCKPTRCTVPSRRNLAEIWPEFPRVALIARGLTSFLGGHFSRIIDACLFKRSCARQRRRPRARSRRLSIVPRVRADRARRAVEVRRRLFVYGGGGCVTFTTGGFRSPPNSQDLPRARAIEFRACA